jgi:acetyl-CoA carboxylase biotin carboxyl carrier protein
LLTFEQMKELVELVARHRLSGLEVERSGFRFKIDGYQAPALTAPSAQAGHSSPQSGLAAGHAGLPGAAGEPALAALPPVPASAAAPPPGLPVHAGEAAAPGAMAPGAAAGTGGAAQPQHILNSPIVGTFYRAPSPDSNPFVEVGSRVRRGQVMCIIEAMKLMNEIESDVDGVVSEVYPQNAQAVEFGEPLFAIVTG